jgi:hypothetical protein
MFDVARAPILKLSALGALALSAAAFAAAPRHHPPVHHRLALDAPVLPRALYLSAWMDGDVFVDGDLSPMQFTTRAYVSDGCRWMGTETLEPIDEHQLAYRYDETILGCEPGATPYIKTPRTGVVNVVY